jgi:hypothetical protein
LFAKMSVNYSADLESRVEPCVFGGAPDCSQCGCAVSNALHWIRTVKVAGPLKVDHFIQNSIRVGKLVNRLRRTRPPKHPRWNGTALRPKGKGEMVQIES